MRELDEARCKTIVTHHDGSTGGTRYQCSRKHKKDGYCTQHHPDAKKAREEASQKKWDLEQHNQHYARLGRLQRDIKRILESRLFDKAVREALQKALEDSKVKKELPE